MSSGQLQNHPKPHAILFDLGDTILEERDLDIEAGARHLLKIANNPRGAEYEEIEKLANELDEEIRHKREETQIVSSRTKCNAWR